MKGERLRAAHAALAALRSPCVETILTEACLRLARDKPVVEDVDPHQHPRTARIRVVP